MPAYFLAYIKEYTDAFSVKGMAEYIHEAVIAEDY